jgi:TonB-linked SusC/RagA family outer membrane protein
MRKTALLLSMLMLLCASAFSQTRIVSGVVRNDRGEPIPFATITETGTKNATQADANGSFSIRIAPNSKITVSAAGHAPQTITPTGNAAEVTLTIAPGQLSEVVVTTAFGIKRSQRVTPYSAQNIGDAELHIIPQTNLNSALAGKIAGVQFRGQSPMKLNSQGSLRIRGGLDLTGDVAPIYVIDGSVTSSFDINPDDVQDVTVLKGANATTLFGDVAKGGAIVINTKKAAPGKTSIEVNQGVTFDKVYVLPIYQNKYAGGASADLTKFTWQTGMPDAWKPLDGKFYPEYTDDASWGPRMVGQEYIPWYAWNPNNPESGTTARLVPQPDNARDFYNTGVTSTTNLSFAKGGPGSAIRLSYTNNSIKGMLPNSNAYRNTLFATVSMDLGNHFTASTNLTYTNNVIKGDFDDAYANYSSGSFNSWFHRDLDMNKLKQYKSLKTPIGTFPSWNLGSNPGSAGVVNNVYKGNYWYNFFTWFDQINYKQRRDNLVGNASLTYKLNNNFKVTGSVRKNQITNLYEFIVPTEIEISATQTGEKASYSTGTNNGISLGVPNSLSLDLVASYNQSFLNNRLNVNVNAGASDTRNKFYTTQMATKNGLNVPGLYAISNSKDQPTLTNDRFRWETRALFASGDVEWNKMVDVSFAIRNDWYSVLLPENNRLLSPAAGLSFFFTDFTKDALPWLSYGKVFGSWGKKPTSGLSPYASNFTYTINQNKWGSNFLTSTPNQAIDPDIHGALIITYEAGIDLKFKNNRYGINALYYNETSEQAPFAVPISGYSGFNSFLTNISKIKRTGLEVVIDARVMTRKDFTWELTKTFGYLISNPVLATDTAGNRVQISTGAQFQGIVPPKVYQVAPDKTTGKTYRWGQLVGTAIKRNADGLAIIDASTGNYVTEANHIFGSVVPRITGGLVNTLTYKNFVLNFNIDYQVGGKFFSLSEMWGTYSGLLAPTAATNDKGWNVRDDVSVGGGVHVVGVSSIDEKTPVDMYVDAQSYFHGLGGGNAIADYFVHSLTFVKLREIALGYNLPVSKWNAVKWVKGITATIVARNPVIIYRETRNFDPSEISGVYGEDGQFPGTRGIGFNLKFNF